jgi:uncharacterized protein YcgI (DUF1989 family)
MTTTIPAREGTYLVLRASEKLRIFNPSGHQVVDLWAFPLADAPPSWLSMAQTRSKLLKLRPAIDDTLIDTRREPLLTLIEDSTAGIHDMLFPPCDTWRYAQAGVPDHDSCGSNLRKALEHFMAKPAGLKGLESLTELESSIRRWGWTPEPLNLFMNVTWSSDLAGELCVQKPECRPGDSVVLQAAVDCLVVMSACPNDLMNTNGGLPGHVEYEIVH